MTDSPVDEDGAPEDGANDRVLTLTDGVVAIAMTLLALDLKPDLPKSASSADLARYFRENFGQYIAFLIAFCLAAMYWRIHHRIMVDIVRSDEALVSANILFLLAITILPLTTFLQGDYSTSLGTSLFALNILLMSLSAHLLVEVSQRHGLRRRPLTDAELLRARVAAATRIAINLFVAGMAWAIGSQAAYLFLLFFVADAPARFLADRVARRRQARSQ